MNPKRLLLVVLATLVTRSLFAQGAPITGTAHVSGTVPSSAAVGTAVVMQLHVDLSGVQGTTGAGTVPAVLGAYQIAVTFDNTRLRFESAGGGSGSGFTSAPTATNTAAANGNGKVTLTGAQISSTAPTGNISVATLTFTTLAPGSAALSASGVSLSSAFVPPSYGPSSIPSTPGNTVVTISALPGAISNPSPADNALVAEPVTLSWTASSETTSYDVYFGKSATPVFLVNTTSTSVPVSTVSGTGYFWRVVSKSAAGSTSSATFHFTTRGSAPCTTPAAPSLSGPASAASGTPFTLSWSTPNGATDYRLDESADPSFTSITSSTIASPLHQLDVTRQVSTATTLYYRVVAHNSSGACDTTSAPSTTLTVTVQPPDVKPAEVRIIPAAISGPGSNGSFFRTALQLHNSTASRVAGGLRFHVAATEGTESDPTVSFTLETGQTLYYPDLVDAIGASGLGSVDVVMSEGEPPRAVIRVFNDAGAAGTTGMFEPLLATADALAAGTSATLIAPPDPIAARYNIGIRTLAPTALTIELHNSAGTLLTAVTKSYPANWFEQDPAATLLGMPLDANDTIVFHVDSGSVFLYGAATDNKTQDPSMDLARP